MRKSEIAQRIAGVHNRLVRIMVSGDDAILMGDSIKEMRMLAQAVQNDAEAEEATAEKPEAKEETV